VPPQVSVPSTLLPAIHAHWLVAGLNSQRSLGSDKPLKSQRFPLLSVQVESHIRAPGELEDEGTPNVP
jgi:hypothetical protein